ncbi:5811_t:CDS:1, partial [Racocetra fulgida]
YLIRNNFRIDKTNKLLREYLTQNNTEMVDLIDIWSTTQPIWEFSRDAIHYYRNVYDVQAQLIIDKLIERLNKL